MADRKTSVDELYSRGRSFPHGQNREVGHRRSLHHEPSMTARDQHGNQDPEDRHAGNYDNDASGWVRGARGEPTGNNEDATGKPMRFDRGNSWRRAGKGNG